jgi:hypothetical protein
MNEVKDYKVKNAMKTREFTGQYGKTFVYSLQFGETGEDTIELSQKPETPAPKIGDVLKGTIEDSQYGKRFKKERIGGFGGFKNDPNTRKEIIRQNALTNAVNFVTEKAKLMDAKKALDYLTGKQIIQVATYFAKYSEGLITVVTENGKEKEEEKSIKEEEKEKEEEISQEKEKEILDDIPF